MFESRNNSLFGKGGEGSQRASDIIKKYAEKTKFKKGVIKGLATGDRASQMNQTIMSSDWGIRTNSVKTADKMAVAYATTQSFMNHSIEEKEDGEQ